MSWHSGGASSGRRGRYATLAAGWGLVAAGGVLVFLPGPGLPLILVGFAVLGRESPWARRVDHRLRALFRLRRARGPKPTATPAPCPSAAAGGPPGRHLGD